MNGVGDWLRVRVELVRASNLPTLWSNVLVGCIVGAHAATADAARASIPWGLAGLVAVAVSLMYLGGMALNDVIDAPRDRTDRPGRPIPSGRISRRDAAIVAGGLLSAGLVMLSLIAAPFGTAPATIALGASLVLAIVAYNVWHAATPMAVVLMGACRALAHVAPIVVMVGWQAPAWAYAPALAALIYTAMLSLIAREETRPGPSPLHALAWAMPAAPLLIALSIRPEAWIAPAIMAIVLTFWLARAASFLQSPRPRPMQAVLAMLAGFCLVDAWTLLLLDHWPAALVAGACFIATIWGHRRIAGT